MKRKEAKEAEKEKEIIKKKIEEYIRRLLAEELIKQEEEKARDEISLD